MKSNSSSQCNRDHLFSGSWTPHKRWRSPNRRTLGYKAQFPIHNWLSFRLGTFSKEFMLQSFSLFLCSFLYTPPIHKCTQCSSALFHDTVAVCHLEWPLDCCWLPTYSWNDADRGQVFNPWMHPWCAEYRHPWYPSSNWKHYAAWNFFIHQDLQSKWTQSHWEMTSSTKLNPRGTTVHFIFLQYLQPKHSPR